jgi:hypothetical protein
MPRVNTTATRSRSNPISRPGRSDPSTTINALIPTSLVVSTTLPPTVPPVNQTPSLKTDIDEALLDLLSLCEQSDLRDIIAGIDIHRVVTTWPRDTKGRLQPKQRALIEAFGDEVPLAKRQPCLLVCSGLTLASAPSFTVSLSSEFRGNQRRDWRQARERWTTDGQAEQPASAADQRTLISQGRIEVALRSAGVKIHDGLRLLLSTGSVSPQQPPNTAWQEEARQVLLAIAPWKLDTSADRIHDEHEIGRKTDLAYDGWQRKMYVFSRQTGQSKYGIGLRRNQVARLELCLFPTSSNMWVPEADWRDEGVPAAAAFR